MIGVFDHPWLGGLFADDEACRIWSSDRQIAHMLSFEAAYSRALGAAGVVDPEMAASAVALIETFQADLADLRAGTARDGLPVPALVAQLREAAEALAPAIHTGTTSQDVLDTALALSIRETTLLLVPRLESLATHLDGLRDSYGHNSLMGRTRMQAAMPITVADRIAAWRAPLDAHRTRLDQLRPRVEMCQLGGAAGDRQQLGNAGDEMARTIAGELGLNTPEQTWHATRDGVVEYAGVLSLITGSLGKIGQDICLMAQQGLDEVTLSGGGGSSAMPHKQNPILAELLVTLARFNATQVAGMHQAMIHEQERSGSAWALEWMILPQMAIATARALSAGLSVCQQITRMGEPRK